MVVAGVVLQKLVAPEEIRLTIDAPERLHAVEDAGLEVQVTVRNAGNSLITVRVTISTTAGKTADLSRQGERTFHETVSAHLGRKFVPVLIEVKGAGGRYAVVKGGNRQSPLAIKKRMDKVEFSKALDVFNDLA
jgi:hypothetical protein